MSIAEKSLQFTGVFEAEVLTELLLWRWDHPMKADQDFRDGLLEQAAESLRRAVAGEPLVESVPAEETNLIAAIYYAEWSSLSSGAEDPKGLRRKWLDNLRASIPSCFCGQDDLPPS